MKYFLLLITVVSINAYSQIGASIGTDTRGREAIAIDIMKEFESKAGYDLSVIVNGGVAIPVTFGYRVGPVTFRAGYQINVDPSSRYTSPILSTRFNYKQAYARVNFLLHSKYPGLDQFIKHSYRPALEVRFGINIINL